MTQYLIALTALMTAKRDDERGATAVEYGLMVVLIAVAIITAVTLLGGNLAALFNDVAGKVSGGSGSGS